MKNDKKKYLVWGAKGHAKVLDEIIRLNNGEVIVFVDLDCNLSSPIDNIPLIKGYTEFLEWLKSNPHSEISAVTAIGGARGLDRFNYLNLFKKFGFETPSLIHPKSHVSDVALIGENSHICALAFVGPHASVGDVCILNTKSSLDHDSILGVGVHLAPGATVCGCVSIGDFAFIGAGATVLPNLKIGKNSIIGAGAVVTKDVPDNVVVYGNPAKFIRENKNA